MKTYRVYNTFRSVDDAYEPMIHEYDITQGYNGNGHLVTTLSRSHNDTWSQPIRGEKLISLIDTGDEMVFPKREFAGDVGYDKFAELYILLGFLNKTEPFGLFTGKIEEVTPSKTFDI